jgi:hypothetical protein
VEVLDLSNGRRKHIEHLRQEPNRSVLFVSACDKLANSRAILKDYRLIGERVWLRFNVGRDGTLAYYSNLADVYRARLLSPVTDELMRVVNELNALAGRI